VGTLLIGLFMPNSVIDNKDIFPIIAPAFSTIVGGFIGLLAGVKLSHDDEVNDDSNPSATLCRQQDA